MANKITIDTTALGITWALNTSYTVEIEEGFVNQPEDERLGNPANASLIAFSTPATATDIASTSPATGSTLGPTNTAIVRELVLTFNRTKIVVGTGNITLKKTSDNSTIQTYAVPAGVTFQNNNQLAIDITDLLEANTEYYILADAGVATDFDGFSWTGISSTTELTFTAPSAPQLASTLPADNSTGDRNETFSFTMDRSGLTVETGNIYLYNQTGPTLIHTFDVSSDITYDGTSTFTFDISGLMLPSNSYYITSDQGIITDNDELESSAWAVDEWNFTNAANFSTNLSNTFASTEYVEDTLSQILNAPDVISELPSSTFELAISPSDNAKVDTLASTGTGGTSTWTDGTKTLTIAGTPAQINSHLDALYMRPDVDVDSTISLVYTCTRDSDSHTSTKTQSVTCSATNAEIVNMIGYDRDFYGDSASPLFVYNTANAPYIDDEGVESTVSYTVTFNSADGQFGIPVDSVAYQDTLTITGNKAYINLNIPKVWFKADDIAVDTTFTYTQERAGISQVNTSVDLLYAGSGFVIRIYDTAGDHTLVLDSTETTNNVFDVLAVGAGAGGGIGGGGGGMVRTKTGVASPAATYTITVGAGGGGISTTNYNTDDTNVYPSNMGDPDGTGPYGASLTGPPYERYDIVFNGSENGGNTKIINDTSGATTGIARPNPDSDNVYGGRALGIDPTSQFTTVTYNPGGGALWRYSTTFRGGVSWRISGDTIDGQSVQLGGTLTLDWTTGEDDGFASQSLASEHVFDTYLQATTPMNSLASGGGGGNGGVGYDGNDSTVSNRGKGGIGRLPSVTLDGLVLGGGGGGINGYGQSGGGNGYNADGSGSAATAGTTGGGGGAGFYTYDGSGLGNTFYPGGAGGDGLVIIISRPI